MKQKNVKVELTIKSKKRSSKAITKVFDAIQTGTDKETRDHVELLYLNEYINKDYFVGNFKSITSAKAVSKLSIKSRIMQ